MGSSNWEEQSARRGLSPRQNRLLDLEAIVEGTSYDLLKDWSEQGPRGEPVPCRKRKPLVQLGLPGQHVSKLVRALTGERAYPVIVGADAIQKEMEQARVRQTMPLAVRDLVVKGSGAIGFSRLGDAASGAFEPLYLDTTWCSPLFVAHVATDRARALREELERFGVRLPEPRWEGEYFWTPEGATSHDLVFLRNEWVVDVEVPSTIGSTDTDTVRTRYRRDYLPHVIIDYLPIRVVSWSHEPMAWKVDGEPRPHDWGVVPVAWARSPGAKPADIDGPSFLTPEILSLSVAADYTKSLANDSVRKIAWPQLGMIDAQDPRRDINREQDPSRRDEAMPSGSDYVVQVQSRTGHQAKLEVLEINGEGPRVAEEHIASLKSEIASITGMVDFDQSKAAGTLSGAALERMLEPKIATVDEWRVPVKELLVGVMRLLAHVSGKAIKPELKWPDMVQPTPPEIAAMAASLATATGGAVMSQEAAVELLARYMGTTNTAQEIKRLKGDAETAMEAARKRLQSTPSDKAGGDKSGT